MSWLGGLKFHPGKPGNAPWNSRFSGFRFIKLNDFIFCLRTKLTFTAVKHKFFLLRILEKMKQVLQMDFIDFYFPFPITASRVK